MATENIFGMMGMPKTECNQRYSAASENILQVVSSSTYVSSKFCKHRRRNRGGGAAGVMPPTLFKDLFG